MLCLSAAEELWHAFVSIVNQAIDKFVPAFKHTRHTSTPTSYPRHIRKLLSDKKARWKMFHRYRTPELKAKYTKLAKRCSAEISKFTANKEEQLCENGNLGAFYKYINKKLNGSNGIAPLKDGQLVMVQ